MRTEVILTAKEVQDSLEQRLLGFAISKVLVYSEDSEEWVPLGEVKLEVTDQRGLVHGSGKV